MTGNYSARRETVEGVDVVRLVDAAREVEVAILPGVGNIAFEWKVKGKNFLHFPFPGPAQKIRLKEIENDRNGNEKRDRKKR